MRNRAGVCVGEIEDMDEVTHAGSIRGVVVGAHHLKIRPAAQGRFDRNWHRVGLRRMPFANSAFRIRPGGIEIAQNDGAKTLVEVQILQYLLDDELASTVWIDRRL